MANTVTSLNETFKYVQETSLNDLKPNSAKLQELAGSLKTSDKIGRKYLWPVSLSYELGFTFGDGTAFSYNADVAGVYDEIELDPNPVVLKSRIALEAAERMAQSDKAMLNHVALRSGQMKMSLMKVAEIDALLGRSAVGLGVVSAVAVSGNATVTLTAATWAPGIWAAMEGVKIESRNSGGTLINTNDDLTLVSVDFSAKQIVLSGNASDLAALAANQIFYFKGAYANGQYGIHYQLDTAGTVFGINNSTYALWKGNEYAVSGNMTLSKLLLGAEAAVSKGGLDEDAVFICSPLTFETLNTDLAALRSQDGSYDPEKGEQGQQALTYNAQFGKIDVVAHPYCMQGYAYLLPKKGFKKVGSTDITFGIPGKQGEFFQLLEDVAAYQMIGRYSWQMLLNQPGKAVLYTGITNS